MTMWLTVLSRVQKGKAWGEREVGAGDVHSKGIGSLAAPRITASWNNTAVKEMYIINYQSHIDVRLSMMEFKIAIRPQLSPTLPTLYPPVPAHPDSSPTPPHSESQKPLDEVCFRWDFILNATNHLLKGNFLSIEGPLKIPRPKFLLKQT